MSDVIVYNITVQKGADYHIDFLTQEDDGTAISAEGLTVEAQLREYPESHEYLDFECTADETGIHLDLSAADTIKIGYTSGYYDVFLVEENSRDKFARGKAKIIPEVTR